MKVSTENDKIRKQFLKSYCSHNFPLFNNEEMRQLEQLIVNYNEFKEDDKEHKSGEITFMNYHIKFEIKEREKVITEKYLLLTCQ